VNEDGVGRAYRRLSRRARRSNLARAQQLQVTLQAAGGGGLVQEERRKAAALAHQIMGSAGTFGYPEASELAARLEAMLLTGEQHDDVQNAAALGLLAALHGELAVDPADRLTG
jgi:HPt (histidine-containing phosphotransfer) domain-containing protein